MVLTLEGDSTMSRLLPVPGLWVAFVGTVLLAAVRGAAGRGAAGRRVERAGVGPPLRSTITPHRRQPPRGGDPEDIGVPGRVARAARPGRPGPVSGGVALGLV